MLEAAHLLSLLPSSLRQSGAGGALRGRGVRARVHPEPGPGGAGGAALRAGAHGPEPRRLRAAGAGCCQAGTAQLQAALVRALGIYRGSAIWR